ncbi:type VI secretion system baseplate subunit TssF, partial [Pandoraea terrae]
DGRAQPQPKMTLQAAGFGPATRLWPQDERKPGESLDAEQGMLEYFTFAEKFHFIDLCGFDAACLPAGETQVAFEIVLTRPLASEVTLDTSNVRLHCTPVINLFEVDAVPIQTVRHEREYRVMSPPSAGPHIEPYAAVSVVALDHRTADKHAYAPFAAFRHRGGMLRHEAPERYYHTRCVRGPSGARELWLTLDGQAWDAPGSLPDDHVTVRVMACNGRLPRMALHESSLTASSAPLPGIEAVRNLLPPTMPLYPPEGEGYQWKVLSHFAPNQLSLLDADVLRETLALYDWTGGEANRRRIEAITDVRHRLLHKLERGGLRRGVEIEVTLDPSGFMGSGDIALFGDVLNRFIGRYASVQHFVQLVLCVAPSDFDRASAARIEFARIEYDGPGL